MQCLTVRRGRGKSPSDRRAVTTRFILRSDCAFVRIKPRRQLDTDVHFALSTQSCEWSAGGAIPRRFIL
jgi:hypothetical protein